MSDFEALKRRYRAARDSLLFSLGELHELAHEIAKNVPERVLEKIWRYAEETKFKVKCAVSYVTTYPEIDEPSIYVNAVVEEPEDVDELIRLRGKFWEIIVSDEELRRLEGEIGVKYMVDFAEDLEGKEESG